MASRPVRNAPNRRVGSPNKILRIGIVQGRRIVEERLVRNRENITVGQSAKNMFSIPSDSLPRQCQLFSITPRGYVANFADTMDAAIAVGNEVVTLAQLKQAGKIKKQGGSWVMLLDQRSRGRITIGDVTVLFQFVVPPALQPRPQLPASVRGSLATNLDWFFTTVAVTSFLAHLCLVIYLRSVEWPRKPDVSAIPDRFVKLVVQQRPPPPPPEPEPETAEEEKPPDDEAKPEKKAKPKPDPKPKPEKRAPTEEELRAQEEERARRAEERRAKLAEEVRNTGILKVLGAKAEGRGSIADVLGQGDVDRDQEKAFKDVGGLTVATGDASLRGIKSGTGKGGKVATIKGLRGSGKIADATTGSVGPERKVKAVVRSEPPAVDGELDAGLIAKEVRTRMGAIRLCYERALKRDPNLAGKIVLVFTITLAGTVSDVDVDVDTVGSSEVVSCIKSMVKRWRFPAPSGGPAEVQFPFVFTASN